MNYIAKSRNGNEPKSVSALENNEKDLFPCFLEVGELEDVGGDGKIATVQSLPTRAIRLDSARKALT